MIFSKHRFTLDMQAAHSQIAIPVTVKDTAKVFLINLTDGGEPYKIPDGSLAMLTVRRPTGTYLQAFCPIESDSTIVYDFAQNENTAIVEGVHDCEVTLYGADGESVVSTAWFTMIVSARVVNNDSLNITDEDRSAVDAMIAAEASRQSAELARINAESGRVDAENSRALAETARQSYYEELVERVNNGEIGGSSIIGAMTATLSASGWTVQASTGKYYYQISVPGVTADATATHVFSSFIPVKEMETEAARCWIRLVGQGNGFVTYEAQAGYKPTINIGVNLIVMG